jgi:ABC-type hemin transport system ATPase subunit
VVAAEGTPWAMLTEDVLEHVFGQPMLVTQTPGSDAPLLVPVRG